VDDITKIGKLILTTTARLQVRLHVVFLILAANKILTTS